MNTGYLAIALAHLYTVNCENGHAQDGGTHRAALCTSWKNPRTPNYLFPNFILVFLRIESLICLTLLVFFYFSYSVAIV